MFTQHRVVKNLIHQKYQGQISVQTVGCQYLNITPNVLRICAVRNNETLKLTTNAEKRIAHIRC